MVFWEAPILGTTNATPRLGFREVLILGFSEVGKGKILSQQQQTSMSGGKKAMWPNYSDCNRFLLSF
jgi:hypothetical protein